MPTSDSLPGTPGLRRSRSHRCRTPSGTAACHGAELSGCAVPALIAELVGDDAQRALRLLADRLMPLMPSATAHLGRGMHDAHADETTGGTPVLYRITLSEKTGRFEQR